ncbi:ferrous iron transport protein B [Atopobium sp. oral taxon 416]|uniref:ferrous iron transport protein B n=1 Tax=Atopobium sp. oral taxon 416 TaxID=712157 RepID=UPI002012EDAF|nr:ferrous iron transport protein B [Atopobium sp. oral taxon 416]
MSQHQTPSVKGTDDQMTVRDLEIGETAQIDTVGGTGALRQHFLDMGVIPGADITLIKYAPMSDPMEFTISGYELSLRLADAAKITCHLVTRKEAKQAQDAVQAQADSLMEAPQVRHPGLGEESEGAYIDARTKDHSHPLPDDATLSFALAGNENCGKTTLFNKLTGANQHVGNFPGVTVDRKEGSILGHPNTKVTDLPGIYSMSPYSSEELVSRQFILQEHPAIIDIVDATNIERNLYLTMQLMELNRPMVLALNMMDEVQNNGGSIDVNRMEDILGLPVVPIAAVNGEGVDELVEHAVHVAHYQELPGRQDFCDENDHGGAVHRCLHAVMHLIEDHAKRADIPLRFAATKLVEGDKRVQDALKLDQNELDAVEHIVHQMEKERGLDRAAAIADMRFTFIHKVVSACVIKPLESKETIRSRKIDAVLTGKYSAIPMFILIMAAIFILTFNVIGPFFGDLITMFVDWVTGIVDGALTAGNASLVIHSLIVDGVFNAVGTVLPILPNIVGMYFFLSLLEDTGYMARVAFVMDKLLRKIGLSGRSIVPMLMGFGCSVPAVMATRTLPSERDRKLTVALIPFMSCSTKLTIYGFFTAAFFPGQGGLIMICLYLLGILIAILFGRIAHLTVAKGEAVPFVMELPNYRMPGLRSVGQLLWEKTKDFLTRAFTTVFAAAVIIWLLQTFSPTFDMVTDPADSMLAAVATWISPIFRPLGFGDWRITTALIAGFMAKEVVVATLSVLFGSMAELTVALTPLAVITLLVFCLLYTPCVAAISAIQRELGGKWAWGIVAFQCIVAYVVALLVHSVGLLLGFV